MEKVFIILDVILALLCAGRNELRSRKVASEIQSVNEVIVLSDSGDTLSVDTIYYNE